jgi:hypothetical protein
MTPKLALEVPKKNTVPLTTDLKINALVDLKFYKLDTTYDFTPDKTGVKKVNT